MLMLTGIAISRVIAAVLIFVDVLNQFWLAQPIQRDTGLDQFLSRFFERFVSDG